MVLVQQTGLVVNAPWECRGPCFQRAVAQFPAGAVRPRGGGQASRCDDYVRLNAGSKGRAQGTQLQLVAVRAASVKQRLRWRLNRTVDFNFAADRRRQAGPASLRDGTTKRGAAGMERDEFSPFEHQAWETVAPQYHSYFGDSTNVTNNSGLRAQVICKTRSKFSRSLSLRIVEPLPCRILRNGSAQWPPAPHIRQCLRGSCLSC